MLLLFSQKSTVRSFPSHLSNSLNFRLASTTAIDYFVRCKVKRTLNSKINLQRLIHAAVGQFKSHKNGAHVRLTFSMCVSFAQTFSSPFGVYKLSIKTGERGFTDGSMQKLGEITVTKKYNKR